MSEAESLKYVTDQIEHQIDQYKGSKQFYRRGSLTQTILAAMLGALTTFFVGLDQIYHRHGLAALSLASAALTTIAAAWGAWFGFRRLWVSNQMTLNHLYELKSKIAYDQARSGHADQATIDSYYESYEAILKDANTAWAATRSSQQ